jgi:hypothetical protein
MFGDRQEFGFCVQVRDRRRLVTAREEARVAGLNELKLGNVRGLGVGNQIAAA